MFRGRFVVDVDFLVGPSAWSRLCHSAFLPFEFAQRHPRSDSLPRSPALFLKQLLSD